MSVVLVLSYKFVSHDESGDNLSIIRTLAAAGPVCGPRDLLPAAFARMRACWNASAAMSDTNFCAARDRRRFLIAGEDNSASATIQAADERGNIQANVFAFKAYPLQVVIRDLVWDLSHQASIPHCECHPWPHPASDLPRAQRTSGS